MKTTTSTPALTTVAAASNPSASMTNTKRCAKRTELLLKIPGVQCASELLQQQVRLQGTCKRGFTNTATRPVMDKAQQIEQLILRTSTQIEEPGLRRFMAAVLRDTDVLQAITTKANPGLSYPIELMRRASRIALNSGYLPRKHGDVLHVAVVLAGVREALIHRYPEMMCPASELLYDFVSNDLRRLQSAQPEMAHMLRLAFDWGGDEEGETEFVRWLQRAVEMAIGAVGMGAYALSKRG